MFSAHCLLTLPTRAIPNCQTVYRRKTKDEQFKIDERFPIFCPIDGIYHLDIFFPAGKTLPLLRPTGSEE